MRIALILGTSLLASFAQAQDTLAVVRGTVVSAEHGAPLSYATITIDSTKAVVFTDSSGTFRVGRIAPGRHHVRGRDLGFTPADTTVEVAPGQTVDVKLVLARVPYMLPKVAVNARLHCRTPGITDSTMSPEVVTLATELVANAERVHLLNASQPYEYWIEATLTRRSEYRPEIDNEEVDTLIFRSDDRHDYHKGDMIDTRFYGKMLTPRYGEHSDFIYLPELEDLAVPGFVSTHCFTFGGVDTVAGSPELRIDFRPLDKIGSADAAGSFFLDPNTFVAKRAVMHMTKGDHEVPPIWHLDAFIWYREIAPLVVVEDSARYTLVGGTPLTGGEITQVEQQRVIQYHPRRSRKPERGSH